MEMEIVSRREGKAVYLDGDMLPNVLDVRIEVGSHNEPDRVIVTFVPDKVTYRNEG